MEDRVRPRPHLTALKTGFTAEPQPFALLTHGCESQRCNLGLIHKTDTKERACFRPAFTPAAFRQSQRHRDRCGHCPRHACAALCASCLRGCNLLPEESYDSTNIHNTGPHTDGRRGCRWGLGAGAAACLPASRVPAPEPLGT